MPLAKTLIDDGENAWDSEQGANVVCTADGAVYKVGTKSAKMAISAGIGAALLATQDLAAATDLSGCHKTRKWIRTSIDITAGQLQLLLDATADCPTPEETLDVPALTANTWALVDVALANPASDGAIVSCGIQQTEELGAFDIYIDDFNGCVVTPEFQKREIGRLSDEAVTQFTELLSRVTEINADTGEATGGSNTTLVDTAKSWEVNKWTGAIIEFYSVADEVYYFSTIISNTANTITCGAFGGAAAPVSGDPYGIRMARRKVGHDITAIGDGRRVTAAAGTRLTLVAASTPAKVVVITAETDNTDIVVVGGATVVAALATRQGTPLNPGDSATLLVDDLVDVYLDSIVTGEGVTYTYLN